MSALAHLPRWMLVFVLQMEASAFHPINKQPLLAAFLLLMAMTQFSSAILFNTYFRSINLTPRR